jgi:hypothetical protein
MYVGWVLSAAAFAATWPAGEVMPEAAAIHGTEEGLSRLGTILAAVVPSDPVDIPDSSQFKNGWAQLTVTGASVIPDDDVLHVEIYIDTQLNTAADPFSLIVIQTCSGYVSPFPLTAKVDVELAVSTSGEDGRPRLDASIGALTLENGLVDENVVLSGCTLGTILTVLTASGLNLIEFMFDLVEPALQSQLDAIRPELETQIETALSAAYLNQDVDVAGIPLHLELYPHTVDITPMGLSLGTEGVASAPAAECISAWDAGGSDFTTGDPPSIEDTPDDEHFALLLSDDFANQALYALWRGGLFCYSLADGAVDLPIPIDTTLLGIVGGDPFKAIWPDAQPLIIETSPTQPPKAKFDGGHDITAEVRGLGLGFYAELDHRVVNALSLDISADAGVDLEFDRSTGALAIEIALGGDDIDAAVALNEFAPGSDDAIQQGVGSLVDTALSAALGPLLEGLAFNIPATNGVGISDLDLKPADDAAEWLGIYADIGAVSYPPPPEGTAACGSCNQGGAGTSGLVAVGAALAAVRRRRR